jgi:hypothetical protein
METWPGDSRVAFVESASSIVVARVYTHEYQTAG